MLTREENELLTQTGPGTPMGTLLRRYWVPALLAEELPEADGVPIRTTLLGEDLLAFRDSTGRVGLVDRHCPHRGASLFFGRNEECGIRCVYHGWKFDVDGHCVDMPSEPVESNFKHKVRLQAYPCVERGGIIWAYLGEPSHQPPVPELEWATVPSEHRCIEKRLQESNWLQALEGGLDLSHISILHRTLGGRPLDPSGDVRGQTLVRQDPRPRYEVVDTSYGFLVAARRDASPEDYYWRVSQLILPWYTMFPPLIDPGYGGHAWVPIDDETCWAYSMSWNPARPLTPEQLAGGEGGAGIYPDLIPGAYRPVPNRDNDFLIDRTAQRTLTFTGIPGLAAQDCAVQESMGPISDRSREHLAASDIPIIALRRRLFEALRMVEAGDAPPGLTTVDHQVRPTTFELPRTSPLAEGLAR